MFTHMKSSCHCGLNAFTIRFFTDSLPVSNDLCHCSSCRHATGQLMVNHVAFHGIPLAPSSTSEPADFSHLISYKTSEFATRWFCNHCSTHIFFEWNNKKENGWCVASGTLERTEGIINSAHHIFVKDTLDGGIASHLRAIDGIELPRFAAQVDTEALPVDWHTKISFDATQDHLPMFCHCRSVSFFITRPSAASSLLSSPYCDMLYPYHSHPKEFLDNPKDEKWWLRPEDVKNPTQYLAGHCACTSCRLTSGFEIQSWAFVPRINIIFPAAAGGKENVSELNLKDPQKRPPGLRHFKSSPGRNREFCARCGATVFWWGDERPELIDVSVALVDEQVAGARAEGWLEWVKERVSFEELAINRPVVDGLTKGLKTS